jgi:hypothetical protein
MVSGLEKASCLLAFPQTKSVVIVQRQFRQKDGKIPPSIPSIRAQGTDARGLYKKLIEKFSVMRGGRLDIGFIMLEQLKALTLNLLMTNYCS